MAEYTVDEANKEIMRRARLLKPVSFARAGDPHRLPDWQRRELLNNRVLAVRQASDEFFMEGNSIITEDETKC